jgi:hypothetical protein
MCGADQKLSRPIDRCHEMSQYPPMYAEVTASAAHQRYQGIRRSDELMGSGYYLRMSRLALLATATEGMFEVPDDTRADGLAHRAGVRAASDSMRTHP